MDVELPPNTNATIFMPAKNGDAVKGSGKVLSQVIDIKVKGS